MCVTKIEAFKDSKGNIYPLETTALIAEAGVQTGENLAVLNTLFGKADKLLPLLQRYSDIQDEKARADNPSAEPTTLSAQEHRTSLLGRLQKWAQADLTRNKEKARQFIQAGGYNDLADINSRAADADIASMHEELDELGVE